MNDGLVAAVVILVMLLYMGAAPKTWLHYGITLFAAVFIFAIVVFFCNRVLWRFNHISAAEAFTFGQYG
ncbi:hypothetical protein [Paenibacillus taichungensis]|uniref:hypothetical protein n=1 Tax=Paenibacillus taichungensis TaxID=484184 RepID=UPI003D9AADFD